MMHPCQDTHFSLLKQLPGEEGLWLEKTGWLELFWAHLSLPPAFNDLGPFYAPSYFLGV